MCPGLSSEGKSGNATMYVCVPRARAEEEDTGAMYDVPPPGPSKKESRKKYVCPHGPEDFFPAQSKNLCPEVHQSLFKIPKIMAKKIPLLLLCCAVYLASSPVFATNEPVMQSHKADECNAPAPADFNITSIGGNFIALV
jgi:hypothetical protein